MPSAVQLQITGVITVQLRKVIVIVRGRNERDPKGYKYLPQSLLLISAYELFLMLRLLYPRIQPDRQSKNNTNRRDEVLRFQYNTSSVC
jgi:hypothetical protein